MCRFSSKKELMYIEKFSAVTFTANGTWKVPLGIRKVRIDCVAAQGNGGANGGRVQCTLNVTPGETLFLTVGIATNAYNASHIAKTSNTYANRVVVAGGGGQGSYAGLGGGLTGGKGSTSGYNSGGGGGTQTGGGAGSYLTGGDPRGGSNGNAGGFGNGGTGWTTGGAGWYGGGGGSSWDIKKVGVAYGGSGGGSSYTHPSLCSGVTHTQGFRVGNGYITISMA